MSKCMAVKTFGVLITTIYNTDIMVEISNSLLDQIIDESKLDLRDIYTAGLRTVIQTCDVSIGTPVTQTLIPRLLTPSGPGSALRLPQRQRRRHRPPPRPNSISIKKQQQ
jgi:hypothetical protein